MLTGIVHLAVVRRGDEAHQGDLDDAHEHGQPHEAHPDGHAPLLLVGDVRHLADDAPGVDGEDDVGEEAGDGVAGVDPHDGGHGDAPPGQARVLIQCLADVHYLELACDINHQFLFFLLRDVPQDPLCLTPPRAPLELSGGPRVMLWGLSTTLGGLLRKLNELGLHIRQIKKNNLRQLATTMARLNELTTTMVAHRMALSRRPRVSRSSVVAKAVLLRAMATSMKQTAENWMVTPWAVPSRTLKP